MEERTSTWAKSRRQERDHKLTTVEGVGADDVQQWELGCAVVRIQVRNVLGKGRIDAIMGMERERKANLET